VCDPCTLKAVKEQQAYLQRQVVEEREQETADSTLDILMSLEAEVSLDSCVSSVTRIIIRVHPVTF